MKKNKVKLILPILFLIAHAAVGQTKKRITICWDVSWSMQTKNLEKEFGFLDDYFNYFKETDVTLLTFSNLLISKDEFTVESGNWLPLKEKLLNLTYDGGTSFDFLADYVEDGDVLLFTDGKRSLGTTIPNFDGDLYVINGKDDFDRATLNLLVIINNGDLLNLAEGESVNKTSTNIQEYRGNIYKGTEGLSNAEVYLKGDKGKLSRSDQMGAFKIKAKAGDTLVISYANQIKEQVLGQDLSLDFSFEETGIQLQEVVVSENVKTKLQEITTAYGKEKKERLGYAVQSIKDEDILDITTDASNAVKGKFSGVKLGQNDDLSQITIRGNTSILGNNYGLIVIDGIPTNRSNSSTAIAGGGGLANTGFIDPNNIAEITVLKGYAATNRYGSLGVNGVLLITTKTAMVKAGGGKKDFARLTNNVYDGKVKVSNKTLVTPYLKELKKGKNLQEAYNIYLEQRGDYVNTQEYFLDVYSFFYGSNPEIAERILTNILEKDQSTYGELRGMYLKTMANEDYGPALLAANRMLKMFPDRIQSYFDVAMANRRAENHQEALNIFNGMVNGSANLELSFSGMEKIIGTEIRNLVNKERKLLDVTKVDQKYTNNLTYNARITLDWNNTDAEFVVQFVNPQKRFFNWEHTEIGNRRRILDELQNGFSTEQFEIVGSEAIGDWLLNVTYLGNRTGGNNTPTFLKCIVQHNFGKPNQKSEEFLVRLHESGDEQQLAKFTVE